MHVFVKLFIVAIFISFVISVWWINIYNSRVQLSMFGKFRYLAKNESQIMDSESGNISNNDHGVPLGSAKSDELKQEVSCTWKSAKYLLPTCSFSTIQAYMNECGFFPGELTVGEDNITVPYFCKLPPTSHDDIQNYFHENVKKMVIMGDSNGIRFAGGIMRQLHHRGMTCHTVKREEFGFYIQRDYFFTEGELHNALQDVVRTCRFCVSFTCTLTIPPTEKHKNTKIVSLEYISFIINFMNASIVNNKYCDQKPNLEVCRYKEYSNFLFRFYFSLGIRPDLLVMYPAFQHDTRLPLGLTIPKLPELRDLIASSLPSTSHVIWFSGLPLNLQAFKPNKTESKLLYGGRNENITLLNHLLFNVLQHYPQDEGQPKFHGFVDVGEVARIKELEWATDMAHHKEEFYDTISSLLLQLLPSLNDT